MHYTFHFVQNLYTANTWQASTALYCSLRNTISTDKACTNLTNPRYKSYSSWSPIPILLNWSNHYIILYSSLSELHLTFTPYISLLDTTSLLLSSTINIDPPPLAACSKIYQCHSYKSCHTPHPLCLVAPLNGCWPTSRSRLGLCRMCSGWESSGIG